MYDFSSRLQIGERILYEGHSEIRKGYNKKISNFITGIIVIMAEAFLLWYDIRILNTELTIEFLIVFFTIPALITIILPELIYRLFIKKN